MSPVVVIPYILPYFDHFHFLVLLCQSLLFSPLDVASVLPLQVISLCLYKSYLPPCPQDVLLPKAKFSESLSVLWTSVDHCASPNIHLLLPHAIHHAEPLLSILFHFYSSISCSPFLFFIILIIMFLLFFNLCSFHTFQLPLSLSLSLSLSLLTILISLYFPSHPTQYSPFNLLIPNLNSL